MVKRPKMSSTVSPGELSKVDLASVQSLSLEGASVILKLSAEEVRLRCATPEDAASWLARIKEQIDDANSECSLSSPEDCDEPPRPSSEGPARLRVRPIDGALSVPTPDGCTELCDYLYIGGLAIANDRVGLAARGITHVLNMAVECDNFFESAHGVDDGRRRHRNGFVYMHCACTDRADDDITPYLEQLTVFVRDACQADGKILVHCNSGISRSSAAVLACLLRWGPRCCDEHHGEGLSLLKAYAWLKERRPMASPHPIYMSQLCDYEVRLTGGEPSLNSNTYNNNRFEAPDKLHASIADPRSTAHLLGDVAAPHDMSPVYCSRQRINNGAAPRFPTDAPVPALEATPAQLHLSFSSDDVNDVNDEPVPGENPVTACFFGGGSSSESCS